MSAVWIVAIGEVFLCRRTGGSIWPRSLSCGRSRDQRLGAPAGAGAAGVSEDSTAWGGKSLKLNLPLQSKRAIRGLALQAVDFTAEAARSARPCMNMDKKESAGPATHYFIEKQIIA